MKNSMNKPPTDAEFLKWLNVHFPVGHGYHNRIIAIKTRAFIMKWMSEDPSLGQTANHIKNEDY